MKKTMILTALLLAAPGFGPGADELEQDQGQEREIAAVDVYSFTMRLYVPRVRDNARSLGYRKYQLQTIKGEMRMAYGPDAALVDVAFANMVNKTHRLANGTRVSYGSTSLDWTIPPRFNAVGSNRTGAFKTASIYFYVAADPSYNIGELEEDNSLYVMLAGKGVFDSKRLGLKSAKGHAAGTIGCGCAAYGHKSPTRRITFYGPGQEVDDVASVFGRWSMKYSRTEFPPGRGN